MKHLEGGSFLPTEASLEATRYWGNRKVLAEYYRRSVEGCVTSVVGCYHEGAPPLVISVKGLCSSRSFSSGNRCGQRYLDCGLYFGRNWSQVEERWYSESAGEVALVFVLVKHRRPNKFVRESNPFAEQSGHSQMPSGALSLNGTVPINVLISAWQNYKMICR